MNSNLENAMAKQTEQATIQAMVESINNGMIPQGSATCPSWRENKWDSNKWDSSIQPIPKEMGWYSLATRYSLSS